ncbi:MAG: hypothetical protein E3J21_05420 [Anaerolineales bacterium]|nr:MAG: hypothetical protein E3J21_05420 [Anaerolineales bacterium]
MDIFKLGARDIFGIVLPGAVLLFVILYVFWSLPATLGLPALDVSLLKDQGFLLSIVFFIASYLLGYLLRLEPVSRVDKESSDYRLEEWRRRKENQFSEKAFKQLLDQMRRGEDVSDIPAEFDHWLWRAERFPYPVWYLRRAASSYPHEILSSSTSTSAVWGWCPIASGFQETGSLTTANWSFPKKTAYSGRK